MNIIFLFHFITGTVANHELLIELCRQSISDMEGSAKRSSEIIEQATKRGVEALEEAGATFQRNVMARIGVDESEDSNDSRANNDLDTNIDSDRRIDDGVVNMGYCEMERVPSFEPFSRDMPTSYHNLCVVIFEKNLHKVEPDELKLMGNSKIRKSIDKRMFMFRGLCSQINCNMFDLTEDMILDKSKELDLKFQLPIQRGTLSTLYDHAKFYEAHDQRSTFRELTEKGVQAKLKKKRCQLGAAGSCFLCHAQRTNCTCDGCSWVPP